MGAVRAPRNRQSPDLAVQTVTKKGVRKVPLLPHERDESTEASSEAPQAVGIQAHADVSRGLVDTDRREDATRNFNNHPRNKARSTRR